MRRFNLSLEELLGDTQVVRLPTFEEFLEAEEQRKLIEGSYRSLALGNIENLISKGSQHFILRDRGLSSFESALNEKNGTSYHLMYFSSIDITGDSSANRLLERGCLTIYAAEAGYFRARACPNSFQNR